MPKIFQPIKGQLQQWVVEYIVNGELDAVTPAPSANDAPLDEEGVRVVRVQGPLGLISPYLLGGIATRADRYVVFFRIQSNDAFPPGFAVTVVDATGVVPSLGIIPLRQISPPSIIGRRSFITTECFLISQGQALQIGPLGASAPDTPHRIWIGVRGAMTGDDEARLGQMCCCQSQAGLGSDGGDGESPIVAGPSETFSFSSEALAVGEGGDTDAYFRFSGNFSDNGEGVIRNESEAIINSNEGVVSQSANKITLRAGAFARLALRGTAPILYQWFVEVEEGGVFTRTYLQAAPELLVANTTTIVEPDTIVSFGSGTRIRTGITVSTNAVLDLAAELELSS